MVRTLRQIAPTWPWLALALAVVLAARLLVPAGFMPMNDAHGGALVLCSGRGPMAMAHGSDHAPKGDHHEQAPCGFAAMADVAAGGADLALLAAAIVHAMARARRRPSLPSIGRPPRLRPPLRAPPA